MKRLYMALCLAIALMTPAYAHDGQWNPYNEWDWASKAMREDHYGVRNSPRYRPYRAHRQRYVRYYHPRPHYHRHDESHEERQARLAAVERAYELRHGPQVYGYSQRDHDPKRSGIRRDPTSNVTCWPAVEAWSTEANTDEGAWRDAQRAWENVVRAMVGERWMEVANAKDIEKQCWVSSGNQSAIGRVAERVGEVLNTNVDGRRHRCRIMARPCQAPIEHDPQTKGGR